MAEHESESALPVSPRSAEVGDESAVGLRANPAAGDDVAVLSRDAESSGHSRRDLTHSTAQTHSVAPAPRVLTVHAVIPVFNRADDLANLIRDLAGIRRDRALARSEHDSHASGEHDPSVPPFHIALSLHIIDNASDEPIASDWGVFASLPPDIMCRVHRLDRNVGGSGGFNAGMQAVVDLVSASHRDTEDTDPPFVWLLDSDARVTPETLSELVASMCRRPDASAIGSAIADPVTRRVFEVGGRVDRRTGRFGPVLRGVAGALREIECDYAAACSVLVRLPAIVRIGLMPDVFLNADDVEWFIRMRRATGESILCATRSIVIHPRFDRFALAARYYVARNALGPLRALGLPRRVLLRRGLYEVVRAIGCELAQRPDLARLHMMGVRDAAAGRTLGPAPADSLAHDRFTPLDQLGKHLIDAGAHRSAAPTSTFIEAHSTLLRELSPADLSVLTDQIRLLSTHSANTASTLDIAEPSASTTRRVLRFLGRIAGMKQAHICLVNAKMTPESWFSGRWTVMIAPACMPAGSGGAAGATGGAGYRAGFVVRAADAPHRVRAIGRAVMTGVRTLAYCWQAAGRRTIESTLQPVTTRDSGGMRVLGVPPSLSLSIIVLSYNRREMLCSTLKRLDAMPELADAELIVVDNASSDGSAAAAQAACPRARIIALESNTGVAALNTGVAAATRDAVLVLDDDAWPEPGVLPAALALLARRADIDAVALHPHHPHSRRSEWPFAASAFSSAPVGPAQPSGALAPSTPPPTAAPPTSLTPRSRDQWPVMGCANLVRRDVWHAVGGYESGFFLYRNDVDLALKILARQTSAPSAAAPLPGGSTRELPSPRGVHFNPAWIVWHDSPAAASKSNRWHELATRNWIWTARRHGRGLIGLLGLLLGWLWAHRLAGLSFTKHLATLRGAMAGVFTAPPRMTDAVQPDGRHFAGLIRMHLSRLKRGR